MTADDKPIASDELAALLRSVLADPDKWLATPNPQFGGRKPIDLIGASEESRVVNLLRAVDRGLF